MAIDILVDSGSKGTLQEGIILTNVTGTVRNYMLNRSTAISEDYNVNREIIARKIIKECADAVYKDYIK